MKNAIKKLEFLVSHRINGHWNSDGEYWTECPTEAVTTETLLAEYSRNDDGENVAVDLKCEFRPVGDWDDDLDVIDSLTIHVKLDAVNA